MVSCITNILTTVFKYDDTCVKLTLKKTNCNTEHFSNRYAVISLCLGECKQSAITSHYGLMAGNVSAIQNISRECLRSVSLNQTLFCIPLTCPNKMLELRLHISLVFLAHFYADTIKPTSEMQQAHACSLRGVERDYGECRTSQTELYNIKVKEELVQ